MRRAANLAISQWFRSNSLLSPSWASRGPCGLDRPDLPWVEDGWPTPEERMQMATVCASCPVITQCAQYAVYANGGRGIDGGFYAGVWLPWSYSTESEDTKLMRTQARRRLKKLLKPEVVDA